MAGEQVALDLVATLLAQEPLLRFCLHALGDNGKVERLAERDDSVGNGAVVGIGGRLRTNERSTLIASIGNCLMSPIDE